MAKGSRKGGHRQFTDPAALEREQQGKDRRRGGDDDDDDDDDDDPRGGGRSGNKMNQQNNNVGMLPPNSDDDDEDEAPAKPKGKPTKKVQPGDLPPSDSEDDDDDESDDDESDDDDGVPPPPPPRQLTRKEREALEAQQAKPDPEQVAADMERLRLARERRAKQAAARIAAEGYDRFAPPPGVAPAPNPLAAENDAPKDEA
eukprot:CAMPEP_0119409968 /NCGR_PEP_ID=MMETSP1335-20130426/3121_1 /TAXON_ID=259385 /ORGANISM="Chrysoculter rhomboideus, Strain RCC1486" /LENGTH=200 /DNA_ID=CAMNT_0007434429 /DNA_START=54 /DNA_END=656 /DNA_ORIENTATION=-